jgi:hypothetical protein
MIAAVLRSDEKSSLVQRYENLRARLRIERPEADTFLNRDLQARGLMELFPNPLYEHIDHGLHYSQPPPSER